MWFDGHRPHQRGRDSESTRARSFACRLLTSQPIAEINESKRWTEHLPGCVAVTRSAYFSTVHWYDDTDISVIAVYRSAGSRRFLVQRLQGRRCSSANIDSVLAAVVSDE